MTAVLLSLFHNYWRASSTLATLVCRHADNPPVWVHNTPALTPLHCFPDPFHYWFPLSTSNPTQDGRPVSNSTHFHHPMPCP
jgi:hypothetical protein